MYAGITILLCLISGYMYLSMQVADNNQARSQNYRDVLNKASLYPSSITLGRQGVKFKLPPMTLYEIDRKLYQFDESIIVRKKGVVDVSKLKKGKWRVFVFEGDYSGEVFVHKGDGLVLNKYLEFARLNKHIAFEAYIVRTNPSSPNIEIADTNIAKLYAGDTDPVANYGRTETLKLLIPQGSEIDLFEYWDNMFRVWSESHTGETFNRYSENGGVVAVVNPNNELSAAFFPDNRQDKFNAGKFKVIPPKVIIDSLVKVNTAGTNQYTSIEHDDYNSSNAYKLKNVGWDGDRRQEALIKDLLSINVGKLIKDGTKAYWQTAKELGMDKAFKNGLAQ